MIYVAVGLVFVLFGLGQFAFATRIHTYAPPK